MPLLTDPAPPCPHGMAGGDQPDPWLKGKLACPQCRKAASDE